MNIDIVGIVAIVGGISLTAFIFYKIVNFIQFVIDRKSGSSKDAAVTGRLTDLEHQQHLLEKQNTKFGNDYRR